MVSLARNKKLPDETISYLQRSGSKEGKIIMDDFEQRLKAIKEKLDASARQSNLRTGQAVEDLKARRTAATYPSASLMPPAISKASIHLTSELGFIDDLADESFHFSRILGRSLRSYPTFLCQTLEEFYQPLIKAMDVPESRRESFINDLKSKAEELSEAPSDGEVGVHWPGWGCFINGWLIAKKFGVSPSELLKKEESWSYIVSTVMHEKAGHGFISEFSAHGKEKKNLHLERYDAIRRFQLKHSDSPAKVALEEKWKFLFHSSKLCEEGYAEWVENFLRQRWQGAAEIAPKYTISQALDALSELEKRVDEDKAIISALKEDWQRLFSEEELEPGAIQEIVTAIQTADNLLGDMIISFIGLPLRYVAGYLLLEKAAQNLGANFAPYAVLIASNITYDLERVPLSDFSHFISKKPELNIDTRLAMIARLKLDGNLDIYKISREINRRLGFAIPRLL